MNNGEQNLKKDGEVGFQNLITNPNNSTMQANNDFDLNKNVYSLCRMCFSYTIHFLILSILVEIILRIVGPSIINFLAKVLLSMFHLNINSYHFIFYICFFVYYFIGYYLLSRFSIHDTFLRNRRLKKEDSRKFLIYIIFVLPAVIFGISIFLKMNSSEIIDYISYFVELLACMAGVYLNRKRIKIA